MMWVLSDGIRKQPESYKGLTKFASFQEVQEHLHQNKSEKESKCGKPCAVAQARLLVGGATRNARNASLKSANVSVT